MDHHLSHPDLHRVTAARGPGESLDYPTGNARIAASNIVEGCSRSSEAEYLRFLEIAYGSAKEVEYQIGLSHRLGFLESPAHHDLASRASETAKVLNGLIEALRRQPPPA